MLPNLGKFIASRLFQQPKQLLQPPIKQLSGGIYTWDGKSYGATGDNRQLRYDPLSNRVPSNLRDYNEVRMRGTIDQVLQADKKGCRFILRTTKLYKKVNPGGSWRWAESHSRHLVFGAGANLPNYLPCISVGARVDLSGMVLYRNVRSSLATASDADSPKDESPAEGNVAIAEPKEARLRLTWIKPVEEEETVEVNFGLNIE